MTDNAAIGVFLKGPTLRLVLLTTLLIDETVWTHSLLLQNACLRVVSLVLSVPPLRPNEPCLHFNLTGRPFIREGAAGSCGERTGASAAKIIAAALSLPALALCAASSLGGGRRTSITRGADEELVLTGKAVSNEQK